MNKTKNVESSYKLAQERYAQAGVDTEQALKALAGISISIHCWQADDVGGFENAGQELGGGLAVTGNYHLIVLAHGQDGGAVPQLVGRHGTSNVSNWLVT